MIGPEIPTHLLASKRESDPEDTPSEEPAAIGPQIPASLASRSPPLSTPQDEEEEDDYAPALPPDMLASRSSAPASRPEGSSGKMALGSALLPSLAAQRPVYDEDDDDDYGPAPLPAGYAPEEKDGVQEFLEKEEKRRKQIEEASKPKALKREEWMLVPPSASDLLGSIDPTRMKRPRQFAKTAQASRDADNSLWTETPAERQQRIADEVAGKRRRVTEIDSVNAEEEQELRKRRRHEEEVRRGVEEHTRKVRGGTLLDQHSRTTPKEDENEEGPPAIWDHGRDMALGGRLMDDKSREKFIREARGLGDRFGSGQRGGFL